MRALLAVLALAVAAALGACGGADPGYRGRSSRDWIAQLGHPDMERRVDAAWALGEVLELNPDAPRVVRALVAALADSSDPVRVAAAGALRNAAGAGGRVQAQLVRDAVPAVAALLADTAHPAVRAHAVGVLADLGPAAAHATVPRIASALDDPATAVRRRAAEGAGALGPAARPVAGRLAARLTDGDSGVRQVSATALARIGGPGAVAIPALAGALGDSVGLVRAAAADALVALARAALDSSAVSRESRGPLAGALEALHRASRDPSVAVRVGAVTALGLIGDPASRPTLTRALGDPEATVRREAAHALSALHRRGEDDPPLPEPSRREVCAANPRQRGC